MIQHRSHEQGNSIGTIIAIVTLVILVLVFGGFSVWSYTNYLDQKQNVDEKVSLATAKAIKDENEKLQKKFEEDEKKPYRTFYAPADYGRLTFNYPKTWSASQFTDVSKGGGAKYEAYLNKDTVPPVTATQKFAIRISIEQKTYDQTLASYAPLLKKGDLKSNPYSDGNLSGTMLTGNFTKDMVSTALFVKMRDRTLMIRTDGDGYKDDYAALLKTVKFNE